MKALKVSVGTLNTAFVKDTHAYTLTLPAGTSSVTVTPTATNKNFQVRTSVGNTQYKRTAAIPVAQGTVITVKCGDPSWPSMNGGSYGKADSVPAQSYTLTVDMPAAGNTAPTLKSGVSASIGANVTLGDAYSLNLSDIFEDAQGDALTYTVAVNGAPAVTAAAAYTYTPATAGTATLAFRASDGAQESPVYTVTLTTAQDYSRLASLIIHTSTSPSHTNVLIKNPGDSYTSGIIFDPETLNYSLDAQTDSITQLRFRALPAEAGAVVTLHDGSTSKDITWTSGSSKWANCLAAGRNTLTLTVTPPAGSKRLACTYTFTVDSKPTLSGISASAGGAQLYLDKAFTPADTAYTLTVPTGTQSVEMAALPKAAGYTLTYNGNTSGTVDITSVDHIDVAVTAGSGNEAVTNTYTFALRKVPQMDFRAAVSPADAVVKVYDQNAAEVRANANGSFTGMFGSYPYTYAVTKYGYVAATGVVPAAGGQVNVTLTPAQDDGLADVGAYWKNFRGSSTNMAITNAELPTDTTHINLKWNVKLGSGWSAAPAVQIIADNALIVMSGTTLYKLDLQTGAVLSTGTMAAAPSFGYTPPIYAQGMILCPLGGGRVQAFNARTLESLWVYTDPLGGQALSSIAYDDGYAYVGFWNGETKTANFVCLSVTDEDVTRTDEAKIATWRHSQPGGFYWAGAAVVGNAVIVGTDDGTSGMDGASTLYSFDKHTGAVISALRITGDQRSSIAYVASAGKVYFTTKCGYLYSASVNASTGALSNLKGVNYQAQTTSTPVVYKGRVYFATGSGISSTGSSGNVVIADAETLQMINAIGLKGYPQCSLLLTTAYEADTGYLYLYSTYNNRPGGLSMIKTTADAPTGQAQLIELYDAAGFENYGITSPICGPDGTIYYKNDSGNVFAIGVPEAVGVMKLINAIGTVTMGSQGAIAAARNAYDALPDTDKGSVTNYAVLTAAESAWQAIAAKIDRVKTLIDRIGSIEHTDAAKARIDAARAAFDQLAADEEAYVTNLSVLTAAEKKYARLRSAANVTALIDAIGAVTKDSQSAIKAARQAYDALSGEERALVGNYAALTAAERAFAALEPEGTTKVIGNGDTKVVLDGVTYMVDAKAAGLMKTIAALAKTEEAREEKILEAYRTYQAMRNSLKAQVFNYEDLEALTQQLGETYHRDATTGLTAQGLPWYVRIQAKELTDGEVYDELSGGIGSNTLIRLWDISLTDMLTGEKYQPAGQVKLTAAAPDVSAYADVRMVHRTDDGRMEYLACTMEGGILNWAGEHFSCYGLIGGVAESSQVLSDTTGAGTPATAPVAQAAQARASALWVWLLIGALAAAGVAAVLAVVFLKKKRG